MKKISPIILRALPLVLLALGLYYFAESQWGSESQVSPAEAIFATKAIGQPALDFTLQSYPYTGEEFHFEKLRGQAVILNFWATWCAPCIKEMPALLEIARKYKDQGLKVVAVSIDNDFELLDRFFKRYPQLKAIQEEFVIVLDPRSETALRYGASRFPETYLINRNFMIENKFAGEQPWTAPGYEAYYQKILQK